MADTPSTPLAPPNAPPLRFGAHYDFRHRVGHQPALAEVYRENLEQIALLDQWGLDMIWFSEHHFDDSGYLPNFVPVAGAVAARTSRVRISTNVALLSFAHPIRLAEDLGILDQLSNGRMELGAGLGYAPHEFRGFGIPISHRVSRTEECLDVLRLAATGERFSYHGRRYQFEDVRVTPRPIQPSVPIWLAMTSAHSVRHAVEHDTHVLPQGPASLLREWRDATATAGRAPEHHRVGIIRPVLVADDPERELGTLREASRYAREFYTRISAEAGRGGRRMHEVDDGIPQMPITGSPTVCIDQLTDFIGRYQITDVVVSTSFPGVSPALVTPFLERFTHEVVPGVRTKLGSAGNPPPTVPR